MFSAIKNNKYLWIFVLTFLLYAHTLSFDFVYFDDDLIILNQLDKLGNLANLPSLFSEPLFQFEGEVFYRPIMMVTYMIDTIIGNGNPLFYHLSNVLLHCIACLLLFYLLQTISSRKKINFILTLLFAFHPVLTQPVAWIPRGDILLGIFTLLSTIFFIKYIVNRKYYLLIFHFIFFLSALFTKENAIAIPLICLASYLILSSKVRLKDLVIFVLIWLYAFVPWIIIRNLIVPLTETISGLSLIDVIQESFNIFFVYLGKVFLPINLSPIPIKADTPIIYGIISLILLLIIIWRLSYRDNRKAILGIFWFLLFMLPTFIATAIKPIYYESRLYAPIIGFFITASQIKLPDVVKSKKKISYAFIILILLIFSYKVISYSRVYKNKETFWDYALKNSPHSGLVQYNVGVRQQANKNYEKATERYKKAIKYNPKNGDAYNNLAAIYLYEYEKPDSAIHYLKNAIAAARKPKQVYFYNLAVAYGRAGKHEKSENAFRYLLRAGMETPDIYYSIALTYHFRGKKEEAIEYCRKALEVEPTFKQAREYIQNETE